MYSIYVRPFTYNTNTIGIRYYICNKQTNKYIMTLQFQITYSKELQLFDLLTQDISENPPTFLEHYHFKTLSEVNKEIENQMDLIN